MEDAAKLIDTGNKEEAIMEEEKISEV